MKGEPRARFLHDKILSVHSHPVDWLDAFLPVYTKRKKSSMTPHHLSMDILCNWSNMKATLLQMGTKSFYPRFKPFTTCEFEQYFYLFFWNGLCPSPQIDMKLQTEEKDPIHSSAFLRRVLGDNASLRLREFKCCFVAQDPKIAIPPRKTHPNFKVDEYFRHLQLIFRYAWMPARDISGDEQTMGFKGKHADKLRITYKKEGDGFQCDCICDEGYTFTFYFRNQPAPKKWLDKGFSPLHARCMALYDCFMDEYHQVRFDNLYMSAKFCLGSYTHPKKVMAEGVCRTGSRGLTALIVQHEVTGRANINAVKGTVKAALLEGCPGLATSPLVAVSVYDTKPVHFLSMCCTGISWIEKTRDTWDDASQMMRKGTFLRLGVNDSYNVNMNNVDVADQLRGSYRPDRWMRKMKWWWAMFFCGHGTLLVNVYVSYRRYMTHNGRTPMSHYEFCKAIVLAKICPQEYSAPKQRESIPFQRGDHRGQRRSSSSVRSLAMCDAMSASTTRAVTATRAKKAKTASAYVTAVQVKDRSSVLHGKRLNPVLSHLPSPVVQVGDACTRCRWATGNK